MTPPPNDASPPWSRRLIAELDAADQRAKALAANLSPDQLNWNPRPGAWSVGQCLEHLSVSNEVYLLAISESLANQPSAVVQDISIGWFGRWFIRNYVAPPSGTSKPTKAPAPGKIRPGTRVDPGILDRFIRSNEAARQVIRRATGHDVNRIRFKNPLVSVIRFTVGTGLEIISQHEQRHLLQAERVRESANFPR